MFSYSICLFGLSWVRSRPITRPFQFLRVQPLILYRLFRLVPLACVQQFERLSNKFPLVLKRSLGSSHGLASRSRPVSGGRRCYTLQTRGATCELSMSRQTPKQDPDHPRRNATVSHREVLVLVTILNPLIYFSIFQYI